jgi:hypothetical protein
VPYIDRFTIREELMARVGDYYWVSMTSRKRQMRHDAYSGEQMERTFAIYDLRMNLVNQFGDPVHPGSPLKEYLVANDDHFDQLYLLADGSGQVQVWVQRYAADGQPEGPGRVVGRFPFAEPGNSFLLVRSEDRNRTLLAGFEFVAGSAPRLHTFLFDADWQQLSARVYNHPFLTQPMIQDDYSGYPLEDFDNGPIKLANNGEWLMLSASRTDNNYLLFHFNAADTGVSYRGILLPGTAATDDISLTIDNSRGDALAGILSSFHYSTLKNIEVAHYSMVTKSFDFDSSYRLTTLGGGRVRNDNLVKENFMAVPGKGFLLMKEYGRPFDENFIGYETTFDEGWEPARLFADFDIPDPDGGPSSRLRPPPARYGYARYPSPVNLPFHDRGDLSLYYFPGYRGDSCWSGMISQEQVTELNSPNLSYRIVPLQDKLFCLYNSFVRNDNLYASSTVLNPKGQLVTDQGVLFWGLKTVLDFQRARQVSPDQVIVPYDHFSRTGFAVILFRE